MGIFVGVGGAAATQHEKGALASVFNAVGSSRRNQEGVARLDLQGAGSKRQDAFSLGNVIKLFGLDVQVKEGFSTHRNLGFGKALVFVAMGRGMHQLPDFRAVLGDVGDDRRIRLVAGVHRLALRVRFCHGGLHAGPGQWTLACPRIARRLWGREGLPEALQWQDAWH